MPSNSASEPNSLPALYTDWDDWRAVYGDIVEAFYKTPGVSSDLLLLRIQLGRLGFVGGALDAELEFIVGNRSK